MEPHDPVVDEGNDPDMSSEENSSDVQKSHTVIQRIVYCIRRKSYCCTVICFIVVFMTLIGIGLSVYIVHNRMKSNEQVLQKQTIHQKTSIMKIDEQLIRQSANIDKFGLRLDSLRHQADKLKDKLDNSQSYFSKNDKNIEELRNRTENNQLSVLTIEEKLIELSTKIKLLTKDLTMVKRQQEITKTDVNKFQHYIGGQQHHKDTPVTLTLTSTSPDVKYDVTTKHKANTGQRNFSPFNIFMLVILPMLNLIFM